MADDIARVGLQVDTSQIERGKIALDQFAGAAAPAAAGATRFQQAAAGAASGAAAVARQSGLARHELVNLGRQVQDVGTMAAMGASPFAILASQGAQVFDIFSSSQGTLRGFASQLASVITPMRLLGGVTAVVGVATFALERSWRSATLAADDHSRAIGVTIDQYRALDSAAKVQGIEDFGKAAERFAGDLYDANNNMGRLGELLQANGVKAGSFTDSLANVANLVKNAASDQQRLQILQQAGLPANMQWVRFMQQGGDAVRAAVSEANKFGSATEQDMIRKAREFDEAWNKAWDSFGKNARSAVVTAASWLDQLDKKATEWLAGLGGESGLRTIGGNLLKAGQGSQMMGGAAANDFYTGVGGFRGSSNSGPATIDPEAVKRSIALEQQRISALGNLASVTDQVRQKENELRLLRMQPGSNISDSDVQRIRDYTEAQALGTLAIRGQADSIRIESAASEMGAGRAAAFRAEQERLAEFRRLGIQLTDAQTAALKGEAAALGAVTQASAERRASAEQNFQLAQLGRTDSEQQVASEMRRLYGEDYQNNMNSAIAGQIRLNSVLSETKSIASSAFSDIVRGFREGKSAGEVFESVLTRIQNKFIDLAADQFGSAFAKSGGGILSGIFGGGGAGANPFPTPLGSNPIAFPTPIGAAVMHSGRGPGDRLSGRYIHAAHFNDAPRFHTGIGPNEMAAVIRRDESVLTPGQMGQLAPVGSAPIININTPPGVDTRTETSRGKRGEPVVDIYMTMKQAAVDAIGSGDADGVLAAKGTRSPVTRR
jgi:hypothetical protein